MEMTFIQKLLDINTEYGFVPVDLFILIAALYVLGMYFKYNKFVMDKHIPLLLLVFSCVASVLMVGLSMQSVLQGILCWGVAIALNQSIKQFKK